MIPVRAGRTILVAMMLAVGVAAPIHGVRADHASGNDVLWRLVEGIAASAGQGVGPLIDQWPGDHVEMPELEGGRPHAIEGGRILSGNTLHVSRSEIRLRDTGTIDLSTMNIAGGCATSSDLGHRFRIMDSVGFPQPGNPDPITYRRVDLDGVLVSFGFLERSPGCLIRIVFDPNPQTGMSKHQALPP